MSRTFALGEDCVVDLDRLVDTRALVQGNSGAGKSYLIRRILEQTHGKVQHLVIDPEGEFSTLREKFDYVYAAPQGGDTAADPRTAALLAERLLDVGASAILDIFELDLDARRLFVRRFVEAIVDAPKTLWHPALVVIDELHDFCPQDGEAESAAAVKSLASKGRKRGFSLIAATQRISKLHKDVAAECNNKLTGRTGLDVDVKRAAEDLGMTKADATLALRALDPEKGEWYAYGPAICASVQRVHVGPVQTKHPKAGSRMSFRAPPPTDAVRALLPKLSDLPAEAEKRTKSLEDLKKDNAQLRRELTEARKAMPAPTSPPPIREEREVITKADAAGIRKFIDTLTTAAAFLPDLNAKLARAAVKGETPWPVARPAPRETIRPVRETKPAPRAPVAPRRETTRASDDPVDRNPAVEQKVLDGLAELEAIGVDEPSRSIVAFMSGYGNPGSRGFRDAVAALIGDGEIVIPSAGQLALTAAGHARAVAAAAPTTNEEMHDRIVALLKDEAAENALRTLIAAECEPMTRADVAKACSYDNPGSRGFRDAIARLIDLGFVRIPAPGAIAASDILFPVGA